MTGCNRACENILGLGADEMNGRRFGDVLIEISLPDHRSENDREWIRQRFDMYSNNNGNVPGEI
jgi:PAS domain-containing protein